VNGKGVLIGDTLYAAGRVEFAPLPSFVPERFALARNRDTAPYKQFRRGLAQLEKERAFRSLSHLANQAPLHAAGGPMQFELAAYRLEHEFGACVELSELPYRLARQIDVAGRRCSKASAAPTSSSGLRAPCLRCFQASSSGAIREGEPSDPSRPDRFRLNRLLNLVKTSVAFPELGASCR
jgi:peptide chain release factor 3